MAAPRIMMIILKLFIITVLVASIHNISEYDKHMCHETCARRTHIRIWIHTSQELYNERKADIRWQYRQVRQQHKREATRYTNTSVEHVCKFACICSVRCICCNEYFRCMLQIIHVPLHNILKLGAWPIMLARGFMLAWQAYNAYNWVLRFKQC